MYGYAMEDGKTWMAGSRTSPTSMHQGEIEMAGECNLQNLSIYPSALCESGTEARVSGSASIVCLDLPISRSPGSPLAQAVTAPRAEDAIDLLCSESIAYTLCIIDCQNLTITWWNLPLSIVHKHRYRCISKVPKKSVSVLIHSNFTVVTYQFSRRL
jgi:hypothetical protein